MRHKVESLSGIDSFFLHLETPRTPMHSGSVGVFEAAPLCDRTGELRIDDIRSEVEGRLELVPKLRQRVQFSLFGGAAPVWVDDPRFDIAYHVRRIRLPPPGDDSQLADTCAELMEALLDRERPLWEMWFVEGVEGGRVALVEKLHHAVADGLACVELATVLLDLERHPRLSQPSRRIWHPNPPPGLRSVLARELARPWEAPVRCVSSGFGGLRHPLRAAGDAARLADALGTLFTPTSIAPKTSLNVPVARGRKFTVVRRRIDELRRVERRFGVTLNDILLSAVAGGVHCLLSARGEEVDGRSVQALVPVGVDHHGDHRLGNRVSAMLVRLPVGSTGPVARLWEVARATSRCKRHHQALAGELLVGMLDPLPPPALDAVTRLVHHQPFVNLVVTNVPGPDVPLYAMGARMLEAFPIVPLAGNLSIGVAALSYDGQLTVGLLADRDSCPDLDVLQEGIANSFSQLIEASRSRADRPRVGRRGSPPTGAGGKDGGGEEADRREGARVPEVPAAAS